MEIVWKIINLLVVITLIGVCSGFPIGFENSAADFHTQFLTVVIAVLLIVCGVVFLTACLCCERRNGFKEFHNSPVIVSSSTADLDHGHINPIANGEFIIFTPLTPPHQNNNVFLANEQIVGRTEIDCNHADVGSWFDQTERDFPRTKLKYIKEMGRGWFGRVVEGTAQGLNGHQENWTPVAVRILEASATSTERTVFLHDAGIYCCGEHPHILKLLGRSLESVPSLLLQELCPRGDLKKYLRENQKNAENFLSSELPLLWSCQISSGLSYLHCHGLTHPDFAARNCQVVSEKVLKLGDYGLATTLYPEDYYEGAPAVPVRWCAPESLTYTLTTIQPKKVTLESNVWSLGVTLWEIFECGAQPYNHLSDDDVISQVIGSTGVRLAKPSFSVVYSDYLFRLMQLCWSTSESRPSVSQVHLMLSDLMQVCQNNTKKITNSDSLILLQDFDKHWNNLKPNFIVRTDNQDILQHSESLADTDFSDITIMNLNLNKDEELFINKPMSPSLNNLHGSLDNLTTDELDSWLQNVATNTGDMSYVRGLSEAINDLDKTLALENVSSSDSSHQPSPAAESVIKSTNKLEFQLGLTNKTTSASSSKTQNSSLTESMQRTSSESDTEDENWRRKIEEGAYSEKVHQKSKSVTDLMILTHIDYSESDSETPLPSLDYRVNYKNVRYAPKQNLENVSLIFGSEGNLLSVHDKFQEELRRLQEERKDSLLFVPEYNRSGDYETSKDFDPKLIGVDNTFSVIENQNANCTNLDNDKFITFEEGENVTISSNASPSHRNPEFLIEELSNTTDIQPANQVYNVFNVTVDTNFNRKHIDIDVSAEQPTTILTDINETFEVQSVKCFNVPKLTELIQNNDDLINYIIKNYETDDDRNKDSNNVNKISENTNKELNNNVHSSNSSREDVKSDFLQNGESAQVEFDISLMQEEVNPNNMTHSAVFTSTPFKKRTLDTVFSNQVGNNLQFSSNFIDTDEVDKDESDLKYSLETWDNFLGNTMDNPNEFDGFTSEPQSVLFVDGEDISNESLCLGYVDSTFNVKNGNEDVCVTSKPDETVVLETIPLNTTYDCNFTFNAESTENNQGWFLHSQPNATLSNQMEPSASHDKLSESYIAFSVDDEVVAALRNELLMKLPQAQGPKNEQVPESDDWDTEERDEVLIRYNFCKAPLSPIPEESYCEDSHSFVLHRRNSTDSENDDWPEPYDTHTPPVDTETISAPNFGSHFQEPPNRHTPSQDSCCSNDTLFNLEELTTGINEQDDKKIDEDVNKTIVIETKTEDFLLSKEDKLLQDTTYSLLKINDDVEDDGELLSENAINVASEENSTSHIDKQSAGHIENNLLLCDGFTVGFTSEGVDNETENNVNSDGNSKDVSLECVIDVVDKMEDTGHIYDSTEGLVIKEVNGLAGNDYGVELTDITLFLNYERHNSTFGLDSSAIIEGVHPPDYLSVDDLNRLKLNVDYVNTNDLENFMNLNNSCDYVNAPNSIHQTDGDIYEALTDIHFSGPSDMQMMSTSFSESVDIDEQDWDSGSDTRSSSSGEFIWKEGEHEESVKALRAAPQEMNSNDKCNTMDDIDEVSSESSEEDEDGDGPEFVPSAWDKYATPTKSALRSPEKTLEKTEIKPKKQKGVWFKKQKYHCVYEYPREPESPVVNSYDLWQPVSTSIIDWEVDTSPYIPSSKATSSHMDKHSRNIYLGDFSTGMVGLDDEFYISSTAQPFEAYSGFASQFFPGNNASEQWMDLANPYENVTPDSGVEDITPASSSDCNEYRQELKPQVQALKTLAEAVLKRSQVSNIKNNTRDCLGGLRHARNKLKLDLPPSPSAFTVTKVFTIEPEEEPITKQEVPTFTTFGKSRFLVQHVDTPTPDEDNNCKNVSFEALPYKPLQIVKGVKAKVEIRGEASLLDSADEDSGIESSTLERRKIATGISLTLLNLFSCDVFSNNELLEVYNDICDRLVLHGDSLSKEDERLLLQLAEKVTEIMNAKVLSERTLLNPRSNPQPSTSRLNRTNTLVGQGLTPDNSHHTSYSSRPSTSRVTQSDIFVGEDKKNLKARRMDDATLIELVRQFEVLYNRRHRDFKNKLVRENAWQSIAVILNDTPENVEIRWVSLRNRFAAELRKTKALPSGAGAQGEWIHMQAMHFLREYIVPRRTTVSNVQIQCSASAHRSDVWDTMTLTEQSEGDDVCSGSSEPSTSTAGDVTEHESEPTASTSRARDTVVEERMPPASIAHQSTPSSRKRKASDVRQKSGTEMDTMLTSALHSATNILAKEDDEDTTFGNFLLQWRHPIQTILEIIVPVVFTTILVILRSLVSPEEYPASFFLPFETKMLNSTTIKTTIIWSPTNDQLHTIMDETVNAINMCCIQNATLTHRSVANYTELENAMNSDYNRLTTFAGVAFNDEYYIYEKLQPNMSIVFRYPGELNWYTDYIFPVYYKPGVRSRWLNQGGPPPYYEEGFLMLQQQLSFSIIDYFKKSVHNTSFNRSSVPIRMQRLSYPKYTSDALLSSLDIYVGTLFMLSFVYTCINIVKVIITEKEKQLKETMKIMGLPNWLHWTAWFCKSFITIFISIVLMVMLMTIKWYPNSDYTIFTYSHPLLLFIVLSLFTFATITFSFAISSLSSKANVGAAIAGIGWFLLFCPFMTLQFNYDQISAGIKLFISIFSNSAIGLAFRLIIKLEYTGEGLQFHNVWSPIDGENIVVGYVLLMLLFDAILYFLFAIYIEAVFPGQYGVAKPWYFFFNIFNCCNKSIDLDDDNKSSMNVLNHEKEPTHLTADIQIKNLEKTYGSKKVAVKNLSLNMYRNQITALLGHNGAGKSTTISILTGMISPSGGTATVNGCDVRTDIDGVRRSLGICPQHNILFDELTVEEHLYFFGRLKGVPKQEIDNEIYKYLHLLEFTQKAKTQASKLSGGMKRKLSVGIAFCGNSKVVLCDEPTAGMDPSARRALWDLLLSQKKDRTILLTTHFMDEADLLGDRIAIMSNGKLECSGSSFFLKKKYGAGYHLILDKSPECDVTKVTELLGKYIENISVHNNIGSELTYVLSEQYISTFEKMLNELETESDKLGIRSYGISLTTLQEVFIKVAAGHGELEEGDVGHDNLGFNKDLVNLDDGTNSEVSITVSSKEPLLTAWALWRNQILAMFMKRTLSIVRSWLLLLIQICMPIAFLLITLMITFDDNINGKFPMIVYILNRYVNPTTLITREVNNTYSLNYMKMLDSMNKTYINWENQNLSLNAIKEAEKDINTFNTRYITGASFHSDNSITAWFSNQPYHGSPLALQLVLNTILQTEVSPEYNIFMYNHPLPYAISTKFAKLIESNNMGYQISFNLGFSMAFVSAFYVMFYIQERSSKFKHLQFVSGIDVLSFWIPSFICDVATSIITCLCAIITLITFQEDGYKTFDELGRLFALFIAFTFGSLPLMYISSFWHKVSSSGYVRMVLLNIMIGTGGYLIIQLFSTKGLDLEHIAKILEWIFLLMPHYCFNSGIRDINVLSNTKKLCDAAIETCESINTNLNTTIIPQLCKLIVCFQQERCCKNPEYFSLDSPGVGRNILFPCVMGIIFFTILLMIEYNAFDKFRCKLKKIASGAKNDDTEDDDVSKERSAVMYNVSVGNQKKYNLVLHNVSKNYNKLVAVNNVSLGVNKKECFGLLGVNGAGKTTIFKIVTGDLKMSSGDVWINGWNIKTDLKRIYQLIGYCPQFDALYDDLTCQETLTIFALLRGVMKKDCKQLITTLARDFDFYEHLQKRIKELSGGNKRKLSTALALVGDPLVLYLDEPTAGVDSATKRYLWNALCKIRDKGTTIVLTSHSMEECEALCTRLAIMVNGSFKCIGSTQHLKNRFSDGYTLIIKTKPFNTDQEQEFALDQIENFVKQSFENVTVREKHQEMITFYINNKNQLWSKMFGIIERGKAILPIEDYSLGQCSLEQVFLTFTKQQRENETQL
ncbi:hypothetical protein RN001_009508 [Aquatica leii]|uniref:Protein kinase domain-containing protein n=1 Tax=Aquatica leii TaxID=1421715 RepID=A0AAN7P5D1_9COLE|nr:hypothetical protein RN001_009508 [Aquatica leii]